MSPAVHRDKFSNLADPGLRKLFPFVISVSYRVKCNLRVNLLNRYYLLFSKVDINLASMTARTSSNLEIASLFCGATGFVEVTNLVYVDLSGRSDLKVNMSTARP